MVPRPILIARDPYNGNRSLIDWLANECLHTDSLLDEVMDEETFKKVRAGLFDKLIEIDHPIAIKLLRQRNATEAPKCPENPSHQKRLLKKDSLNRHKDMVPQGFWYPRRVDKDDFKEWHLEGDAEWIRPQDVEVSVDAAHRKVDFRAKREETQTIPCENKNHHSENESSETCLNCLTFTSMRETTKSFSLPDDVDLDKVEADMSPDHSVFVIRAPRKVPLQAKSEQRIPIKIIRK